MSNRILGWKYYNHAAIPTTAPHEEPDLTSIKDGSIWHIEGKKPLLARYTTNWDCGYDTGWWYVIKDTPFDISALKTKRRYEITKAMRFFDVKEIKTSSFIDDLCEIQEKAWAVYPAKYRPVFDKQAFVKMLAQWDDQINQGSLKIFGAFFKENGKLCGYTNVVCREKYFSLAIQKAIPDFEKYSLNAALLNGILDSLNDKLAQGYYVSDGARSIVHETHFQDYLEKYFGFRKAYCRLNLAYPSLYRTIISFLFPIRRVVEIFGLRIGLFHQISGILKMEEIVRKCKKTQMDSAHKH